MVKKASVSDRYEKLGVCQECVQDFDGESDGFTVAGANDTWALTGMNSCYTLTTGGADNDNGLLYPVSPGILLASATDLTINTKVNIYFNDGNWSKTAILFGVANYTDLTNADYYISDGGALEGTSGELFGFYKSADQEYLYAYGGDEYVKTTVDMTNTQGSDDDMATSPVHLTMEMELVVDYAGAISVALSIDEYGGNDFKPLYRYGSTPREGFIGFKDKSPTAAKYYKPILDMKAGEGAALVANVDYFAYSTNREGWSLATVPTSRVT